MCVVSMAASVLCAAQSAAINSIPITLFKVPVLSWSTREDTENIGSMEFHVIPNVCSEFTEHTFGNAYCVMK